MSIYDHMPGGNAQRARNLRRISELSGDDQRPLRLQLTELRAELKALKATWEYAFSMADSCCIPDSPQARAVRTRVDDLQARIAELT